MMETSNRGQPSELLFDLFTENNIYAKSIHRTVYYRFLFNYNCSYRLLLGML